MEEEAKIISKHNLDCSSLENLAIDIANRLGYTIDYGQYQNLNGKNEFVQNGTVEVVVNGIKTTLYDLRNDGNSPYNFILELGEEAKVIYKDFIQILPPWEEEYNTVFDIFNSKRFKEEPYYNGVFDELQKLGADKVYFIKDTFVPELAIPEKATLENYLKIVEQNTTYFEVII